MKERHPIADWSFILPSAGIVAALLIMLYIVMIEKVTLG